VTIASLTELVRATFSNVLDAEQRKKEREREGERDRRKVYTRAIP